MESAAETTPDGRVGPPGRKRARRTTRGRIALSAIVVGAVFGFVMPRLTDYGDAWEAVRGMSGWRVAILAAAAAWNLFTYWPVMMVAQPGLRMGQAAVLNQASTAVANTVPAGGAVGVAVTYRMMSAWGFGSRSIANFAVVTGVANQLVKLVLPLLGLVAVLSTGELDGSVVPLIGWGTAALLASLVAGALVLRAERSTRNVGAWIDRHLERVRPEPGVERWLVGTRVQMLELLRSRGGLLSAASLVSHLSLYLVLLAAIRAVGVGSDDLSWAEVLLGFALVRLLSALPLTPGGVGVVELGYVAFLAGEAAPGDEGRIAAAVLVFRAVTYLVPIILGALAWVFFVRTAAEDGTGSSREVAASSANREMEVAER
jgi:putative heme transporter